MTQGYFFDVYGSYEIARKGRACESAQSELWSNADYQRDGLSRAIGCYMFVLKYGKKITPWYVGMTAAQTGFRQEAFTPHKVKKYNEIMRMSQGRPSLFLFPMCNNEGQTFSASYRSGKPIILKLERMLMGFAYAQNPEIGNTRDMHFLRNTTVRGVFGEKSRGRPFNEVTEARIALFGRRGPNRISN